MGINESKITTLFDAFAQVQEGQAIGTGLGLFGVRTRAEALGGDCGARQNTESSTGTGTVLWFDLPYTPDLSLNSIEEECKTAASSLAISNPLKTICIDMNGASLSTRGPVFLALQSENATKLIRARKLTAMVVEDTASVRKLMEHLLLQMGFESVLCCENGSKGLDALMAGSVDIVFSDVQMPIMTGPEVIIAILFDTFILLLICVSD